MFGVVDLPCGLGWWILVLGVALISFCVFRLIVVRKPGPISPHEATCTILPAIPYRVRRARCHASNTVSKHESRAKLHLTETLLRTKRMIISRGRARVALHTYSTSRVGGSVLALRVVAWHTCGAGLWAPTPVIQPGPFALKCVLCQVTSAQYRMHNALYDMQCRVDPSKPECSGATAVPAPRPPLFSSLVTRVVRALRLKVRMYGLVLGTLRGQGHVATTARSFGPSVEPVLSSSSALSSTSACCPSPPPCDGEMPPRKPHAAAAALAGARLPPFAGVRRAVMTACANCWTRRARALAGVVMAAVGSTTGGLGAVVTSAPWCWGAVGLWEMGVGVARVVVARGVGAHRRRTGVMRESTGVSPTCGTGSDGGVAPVPAGSVAGTVAGVIRTWLSGVCAQVASEGQLAGRDAVATMTARLRRMQLTALRRRCTSKTAEWEADDCSWRMVGWRASVGRS